jgi:glutamine amidotransferase
VKIAMIQYNAGNVLSVGLALQRLGAEFLLTDDPELIRSADKVILPGVGEASSAMRYLRSKNLDRLIPDLVQPVLGICLGLQLMCRDSEENDTACLGVFPQGVRRFQPLRKVPHIGWNDISAVQGRLFHGLPARPFVYFLHGYYAELSEWTSATTEYIVPFAAALEKDNFRALQFHPEKSGAIGARILQNFLDL